MKLTKQFLLNMQEDLKQWCHENYLLFIEGNRKQDKPSIGCGEDVKNMFCNPLFEFGKIHEDQSNTFSIIELFDTAIGKEIYTKDVEDSDWFPIKDEHYYMMQSGIFHFLPTNIKQVSFDIECPAMKMNKELHVPYPFHGIIRSFKK